MDSVEQSILWLGAIAGAITSVIALATAAFRPFILLRKRIEKLEEGQQEIEGMIDDNRQKLVSDHHSFLKQEEVNHLLLESTSSLLKHNVDGNNTKQMMDCARRIDDLVYRKGSSLKEEEFK